MARRTAPCTRGCRLARVAVVVSFALLASHDMAFAKAAFETVSALATVGLSIGATPKLNALGKWLILVTMFIGRVGPISLALALGTPLSIHVPFPETKRWSADPGA